MSYCNVLADGEGRFPEYEGQPRGVVERLAGLHHGMESGRASVVIGVVLNDGTRVSAEVSMAHFFMAAAMFEANYTEFERGRQ